MTDPGALTVHPFDIQVGVFSTVEEYGAWFAGMGIDAPDVKRANAAAVQVTTDDAAWFALILPDREDVAQIAHECVHIADFAMEEAGVPTDASNTEVRAHIVADLMRQL